MKWGEQEEESGYYAGMALWVDAFGVGRQKCQKIGESFALTQDSSPPYCYEREWKRIRLQEAVGIK